MILLSSIINPDRKVWSNYVIMYVKSIEQMQIISFERNDFL